MFNHCYSLVFLLNISNWNLENVKNMSYLFNYCFSLVSLPDITKLSSINIIEVNFNHNECISSLFTPEFNNFKTSCDNITEELQQIAFINPLKNFIEYGIKVQEEQNINIFDM